MADLSAFRAYRYDLGRVGALSDVVAPPYDVIDPALQDALHARSPYNVVRLILGRESPTDTPTDNRYTRSAITLRDWLRDDILEQDTARSFYVYHQEFEVEGRRHTRKGFLARVRLEPFGEGRIYPHEQTLPGPRADRLALFRATHMNLSPVFGLYPDPEQAVMTALEQRLGRALPLEAVDHLGVVSRLWPVSDDHTVSLVTGLLGPKPIFIADGHHRYETGLRYLEERRALGEAADPDHPANFILMHLVSLTDPGLIVLPTHRLVSGLPADLSAERVADLLGNHFDLERVGTGAAGAREAWDTIEMDGSQDFLAFGTPADGVWQTARLKDPDVMARLAPDHSEAWQGLGVAILHVLALDHLLAPALAPTAPACKYVHLLSEVTDAIAARACQLAVLVPPAGMADIQQIAGGLEKMPPKSTYFYPKLLSGLVFNSLNHS